MGKRTVAPGRSRPIGPLRVAIYLRVSTAKQVKGYGLRAQEEQCHAWLDYKIGKGWYTVIKVYSDGGVSGKLASRPNFDILNEAINDGQYDLVVFGKLDRIGRAMSDIHLWVYHTTKSGVRVATADGRIDSEDDMFGIQLGLLAYMAETEHTLTLERTMGGRERRLGDGGWPGGPAPYGTKLEGKPGEKFPVVCDVEAGILEQGAVFIVDEKCSGDEAAEKLNARRMFTRSGKPWTGGNLIQKYYATALDGYVIYRNTERGGKRGVRLDEKGNPLYGETVRIPVPCGLTPERAKAVRAALARRSFSKSDSREYLVSGSLYGVCGHHYVGSYRKNRDLVRYQCTGRIYDDDAEGKCNCKEIDAPILDKAVWAAVAARVGNHKNFQALAEAWLGALPAHATVYRERLAELDAQIEKKRKSRQTRLVLLVDALEEDGDGEVDGRAVEDLRNALEEKENQLQSLREDTLKRLVETERQEARVRDIISLAKKMNLQDEDFPFADKLELFEMLDVRIDIISDVPGQVRPGGCPFEAWFEEQSLTIPDAITDGQWEQMEEFFPPRKARGRAVDRRLVMDATLYKLRNGICWNELPSEQFGRWQTVYNNATAWLKNGIWAQAILSLGAYTGTVLAPAYQLPSMDVSIDLDSRLDEVQEEAGDMCERDCVGTQSSTRSCCR
ncbi:recombinase family protein [Streptomyces sp. NPDC050095]|uniref:recombinase family protein n=1 Tax=unclassified Streptomyces TaxID=2593676 RepID=UPI00342FC851